MVVLDLLHGDCLQILKDLSGGSIDCFICDLPFGCLSSNPNASRKRFLDGKDTGTIVSGQTIGACSWDIKIDLKAFWEQVKRLCKNEHTPVLMFCTTKFGAELIASNPSWFRYDLVWDKGRGVSFLSANKMPMRSHEMIYVFSKSGAYYQRIDGVRCPLSVIPIRQKASYQLNGGHPTQKPLELYKWLIERYCPPGGTILDPTAGSFNSCFAAWELDRNAIGIEKDPGFFEKACKRADSLESS